MKYEELQKPIQLGNMTVKNRFVVPAMDTKYIEYDGFVNELFKEYWRKRAEGGFGLLITECTAVDPMGISGKVLQIWDDKFIPGLTELTDTVHQYGAKIATQLYHCGRQTVPELIGGEKPVTTTAIPCTMNRSLPRELTTEEVYEVIEKFGDAALRAKKAGFDAVEIHGGHGYLVSEFMSAYYNKRIDEFGGSFEGRMLFPLKVIENIQEKAGKDFPIIFRISGDEMCPGGRTIEESCMVAQELEAAGVVAINVSVANYYAFEYNVAPASVPPGFNLKNAEEIKKAVSIPVIGVGRINDPSFGEYALEQGQADMIAFGRGSLADPYLPKKVMEDRLDELSVCSGCMEGCIGHIFDPDPDVKVNCVINPFTGHESEYKIEPAEKAKNVIVVGGGPGGLEAAWIAAKRGHNVKLFEADSHLGGQYRIAAVPPFKNDLATQIKFLITMNKKYNVDIQLNTEFTTDMLKQMPCDALILATGAKPFVLPLKGIDTVSYVQANDVLDGKVLPGMKVLIIGGGMVGAETADFLGEHSHQVTIIDMLPEIGQDMQLANKIFLQKRLKEYGVEQITNSKVKEIFENGIIYECNGEEHGIDGFDTIIMASGSKPYNPLEDEAKKSMDEVYVIGDAVNVRLAIDAITEGAKVAMQI